MIRVAFGALIGNPDRHQYNIVFFTDAGRLTLAPAFDQVSMLYAPTSDGQLPPRAFALPLVTSDTLDVWDDAREAAGAFWAQGADDPRVSDDMRLISADNARAAMDLVFERAYGYARQGLPKEVVTGNNDADGVYLLHWARRNLSDFREKHENHLRAKLAEWGGNASGVNVANIDNLGNVHPDTMWWDCTLGNVRSRAFGDIWRDTRHPIMAGLKARPRRIKGRCGGCAYFDVCGGNTRVRALKVSGDPWAEDPGCYLDDEEIAA